MSTFRMGISESIATPGLAILPVNQAATRKADDLLNALSGVAGSAAAIGRMARQDRYDRQQELAKREELSRGAATQAYRSRFAVLSQDIADQKITVPDGMDIAQFAEQLIAPEVEGTSDAYRTTYIQNLTPLITRELVQQQAAMRKRAIDEGLVALAAGASDQTTPEGVEANITAALELDPTMSRSQAIATVALPAAEAAARGGDLAKLNAARAVIGEQFPVERAKLDAIYETAVLGQRQQVRRDFDDEVSGLYVDRRPYELIRERVRGWRGKVDDSAIDAALREADSREAQDLSGARSALLAVELTREQQAAADRTDALMADAANTGGASVVEDHTFTDSAGRDHTITRERMIEASTSRHMARIAAEAGGDAQAALGRQVEFLSRNGVTYAPWERILNAGGAVTALDLAATKDGHPSIPANAAAGYDLYKRLGAMNPRLRDQHIKSPQARTMYELANLSEQYVTPGDAPKSLMMAVRAMASGIDTGMDKPAGRRLAELTKTATETGSLWWAAEARNKSEIADKIADVAGLYIKALGLSPEDAVKEAGARIQNSHRIINGWSVDVGNRAVPEQIEAIGARIATDYAERFKDEGADVADLTLIPGKTAGAWILFNRATLSPVDRWTTDGLFTNADLAKLWQGRTAAERAIAERRVIEAQARKMIDPGFSAVPRQLPGESAEDHSRRIGRKRRGEF